MSLTTSHLCDRNGLEILSREECFELLASGGLGRVGITMRALPVILPVSYAVYDGDVVFRTGTGTKLAAAVDSAVVAFEADDLSPHTHIGWSVCVTGLATPMTDPRDLDAVRELHFEVLPPGLRRHIIRIRSDLVSGRVLRRGPDYA